MEVNWLTKRSGSPIIFNRIAKFDGAEIHHRKVLAGEIFEYSQTDHEINITLSGNLKIQKQTASGSKRVTCGKNGSVCLVSASQPHSVIWDDFLECLTIQIDSGSLKLFAVENEFSPNFDLIQKVCERNPLVLQIGLALANEASAENPSGKLYSESLLQTLYLHVLKQYSTAAYKI